MELTQEEVVLNGGYCKVQSCGQRRTLLFLHAGIADSRMWQPQIERLCPEFQLLAPDLRGFGQSPLPDGPFSYMADIGTILDHFNVESCWLIGASFGSSLAAKYCLAQPARVDGLILIAPTLDGFEPSPSIKEFWRREEELLQADDLAAAVELNLRFWFDGPNRPRQQVDQAKRALVGQMQLKAFQQPEPAGVELTDRKVKDLKEYESLTCPVLMVTGAEDDPAVLAHAHQLLEVLPNAELFELEKGGHMVSMERPGRVNQLILDAIHQERT